MIAVAPISILLITAISLLLLRYLKPNFSYHWFVGTTGVFITWLLILVTPGDWNLSFSTPWGILDPLYLNNFALNFDRLAWFYSIAIITQLVTSLLTSEAQPKRVGTIRSAPYSIIGMIFITVSILVALAAFNTFTTLILWTAADILFLIFWVSDLGLNANNSVLARDLSVRLISLGILFWAMIQVSAGQIPDNLSGLPPEYSIFLIYAAGLRLGVLPPLSVISSDGLVFGSKDIFMRIATYAPALILLTRVAGGHNMIQNANIGLIFAAIALLYAGFNWFGVKKPQMNISYWTCGIGAFVVTAAITLHPQASLMWGLVFLLLGGFFSLYSIQLGWLKPLVWIGILSITSLPFTPTWIGSMIFDSPSLLWIGFLLGQSLLISSLIRHFQKGQHNTNFPEPWIRAFYFIGLALMPIMLIVLYLFYTNTSGQSISSLLNLYSILPGLVIIASSSILIMLQSLSPDMARIFSSRIGQLLGLNWLYRIMLRLSALIQRGIHFINLLLEGQAGIIWAIIILVLFFTLFKQSGIGT